MRREEEVQLLRALGGDINGGERGNVRPGILPEVAPEGIPAGQRPSVRQTVDVVVDVVHTWPGFGSGLKTLLRPPFSDNPPGRRIGRVVLARNVDNSNPQVSSNGKGRYATKLVLESGR